MQFASICYCTDLDICCLLQPRSYSKKRRLIDYIYVVVWCKCAQLSQLRTGIQGGQMIDSWVGSFLINRVPALVGSPPEPGREVFPLTGWIVSAPSVLLCLARTSWPRLSFSWHAEVQTPALSSRLVQTSTPKSPPGVCTKEKLPWIQQLSGSHYISTQPCTVLDHSLK